MIGYRPTTTNSANTAMMVMTCQRKVQLISVRTVGQRLLALITDDGILRELDTYFIGNLEVNSLAVHLCHRSVNAAVCHDTIADFERPEKFLEFLLPALGRQQDDEIEDGKNQCDGNQLNEGIHPWPLRGSHSQHQVLHSVTHRKFGAN